MTSIIKIAAVGDIFLGRKVAESIKKYGKGQLLKAVHPILQKQDIIIGNLESPLSDNFNSNQKGLIAPTWVASELKTAGFTAVSLANNHSMDYGTNGLADTISVLDREKIGHAGAGLNQYSVAKPLKGIGNKNMTLLCYYGLGKTRTKTGCNQAGLNKILQEIKRETKKNSLVIIMLHWGRANMDFPMEYQVNSAHKMIDAGAGAVIGSGPHVLQPVEQYKQGIIAYSLGNFTFDQKLFKHKNSLILEMIFENNKISASRIVPVFIDEQYRPIPLNEKKVPEQFYRTKSLLCTKLPRIESDANTIQSVLKNSRPLNFTKKLLQPSLRAYPLSFYLKSLLSLIPKQIKKVI